MRPSQNAFFGYSYQQCITFLMFAKMDVERAIKAIEIEANVDNNFDDIKISWKDKTFYCQIKDIDGISLHDVTIKGNQIGIKGKEHILSDEINVLFFKNIDVACNDYFFGIPAYKMTNIYIIPLSREETGEIVCKLYKCNEKRESRVGQFFNVCLDKRKLNIKREELPSIEIIIVHGRRTSKRRGRVIEGKFLLRGVGIMSYIFKKCLIYPEILVIEGSHIVIYLKKRCLKAVTNTHIRVNVHFVIRKNDFVYRNFNQIGIQLI